MKIQKQDIYHGTALMQIVEHDSFKALNRASTSYGHYLVNADCEVFVKYRDADASPWTFTFQPKDLGAISKAASSGHNVLVCLVCGTTTICALTHAELAAVVDMQSGAQQWVSVEVPTGGSCHVKGSKGPLSKTIPHNSFPSKVFD
jgi:hypothetical protein